MLVNDNSAERSRRYHSLRGFEDATQSPNNRMNLTALRAARYPERSLAARQNRFFLKWHFLRLEDTSKHEFPSPSWVTFLKER